MSEMVYGQPIKLPGEFFTESSIHTTPEAFANNLKKQMEFLRPRPSHHKTSQKVLVHKDLKTCSHVFLRVDRVRKSLEPPYEGPFLVTERTPKYFTIEIKGKEMNVTIDRLKPAFILANENENFPDIKEDTLKLSEKTATPKRTRTGRIHKLPVRFRD